MASRARKHLRSRDHQGAVLLRDRMAHDRALNPRRPVIPLATMARAAAKCQLVVAQLLCAFILSASFDRLPDPPAVKPHAREAKVVRLGAQLDGCCDRDRKG